ncbi:unnamed protein product [Pleuronectes platessa]|uniref:Uncharacterized protein n=1 Tax=Pleuronectes platessa TaxID=8262 RepID=A0A9N7YS10_PLEPL|nr:unnamed protein product [Pleuronectes platessa]
MNQSASLVQNSSRRSGLVKLVRDVQRNPAVPGDGDPPITSILLPLLSSERHSSILGTPLCTVLKGLFTVKHFKLLEGTCSRATVPAEEEEELGGVFCTGCKTVRLPVNQWMYSSLQHLTNLHASPLHTHPAKSMPPRARGRAVINVPGQLRCQWGNEGCQPC